MKLSLNRLMGVLFLAAVLSGGFVVSEAMAVPASCALQATLSAPGAGSFVFEFVGIDESGVTFPIFLADGQSFSGPFVQGDLTTITEEPQDGYVFAGIECDSDEGIVIQEIRGGFTVDCIDVGATASCVITNVPVTRPIPTLSEWGMIAATAGLGLVGVFFAMKRRKARAGA